MKAAICKKYNSLTDIQVQEVPRPVVKDNDVLIKVYATSVTTGDWRIQSLNTPKGFSFLTRLFFGITRPRKQILGTELSGKIEVIGKSVTKFKVGDEVIATSGLSLGCHAQYVCMPETGAIVLKPKQMNFLEAATLPFGAVTALDFLTDENKGNLKKGEHVLVIGASGSVGLAAVQIAKSRGARVSAVCSARNKDFVIALGADEVIDYTTQDYTKSTEAYDVIFDAFGNASYSSCKYALRQKGRLLLISASLPDLLLAPIHSLSGRHKVVGGPCREDAEILNSVIQMAERGELKAVVDKCFSIDDIAQAYDYVGKRHKKGNVAISVL